MTEHQSPPAGATASRDRLTRRQTDRILAGVCAGLAVHLNIPVLWARIAMAVFALLGGAGVLFYVWLWVTVPAGDGSQSEDAEGGFDRMRRVITQPAAKQEPGPQQSFEPGDAGSEPMGSPVPRVVRDVTRWPVAELLLGGALLVAGVGFALSQFGLAIDLEVFLPGMVVLVGVGLAWWQIADRNKPERHLLPRMLGALALVAVGVLTFFVTASQPSALTVVAAALAVLAGVALAIAPWLLRVNRELIDERSARARESERSEIAAHLHDSVLQTLAAIQQRSEPGSEVARLARGQERELRDWLFHGDDEASSFREAIDVALRNHAAALENDYAVRFEVVAVGVSSEAATQVPEPLLAATREAMLNAAKHAGGEVAVYVEITPKRASIDVTDRGPGFGSKFDTNALPEGRMGVRESIIGRMERAGGRAEIVPGPGGSGASVRMSIFLPDHQEEAERA